MKAPKFDPDLFTDIIKPELNTNIEILMQHTPTQSIGEAYELMLNLCWDIALLERLAPQNPEIMQERMTHELPYWTGGQEHVVFLWRILYAIEYMRYLSLHDTYATYWFTPTSWISGVGYVFLSLWNQQKGNNILRFGTVNQNFWTSLNLLISGLQKKAKSKIAQRAPKALRNQDPLFSGNFVWYRNEQYKMKICDDGTVKLFSVYTDKEMESALPYELSFVKPKVIAVVDT